MTDDDAHRLSTIRTFTPARARALPHMSPAGPAPKTRTSTRDSFESTMEQTIFFKKQVDIDKDSGSGSGLQVEVKKGKGGFLKTEGQHGISMRCAPGRMRRP